jgi:MFS family permease
MSMSQGFLHNYVSIMVVRFFVGILEGPFLPGVIFLLSCWYKKEELGKRIAFLYGKVLHVTLSLYSIKAKRVFV